MTVFVFFRQKSAGRINHTGGGMADSSYDADKEAYTYNHIDVKIQLTKVVKAVQDVRDAGAAFI